MKLAWATDIHLNFVGEADVERFCAAVLELDPAGLLLSGDIAEADSLVRWLEFMDARLGIPIYFVLGNHDFYRGDIASVREAVGSLGNPRLHYLPDTGPLELMPGISLVGHDGWGDARIGDMEHFHLLSDYLLIEDILDTIRDLPLGRDIDRTPLIPKLRALGDEAEAALRPHLAQAAKTSHSVLVLTHVPPFREACWNKGRVSDEAWLPGFTCKAIGDRLLVEADKRPATTFSVLCGHVHSSGEVQMRPNLEVYTGFGDYRTFRLGSVALSDSGVWVVPPTRDGY
jgi:hypothetical protein